MAKINITIDDRLLEKVDNYADSMYMSRSGVLALGATQLIQAAEITQAIRDISVCVRSIADKGLVDEQAQRELDALDSLVRALRP